MRTKFLVKALTILILLICSVDPVYAQLSLLKKKSRICFLGNSITMNGTFYHNVALFYATRYPKHRLDFINSGVGGNVAASVLQRIDDDVLLRKPQICVIMLGMNDVDRELYQKNAALIPGIDSLRAKTLIEFEVKYSKIIEILLQEGIQVILQTPSIYDQTAKLPSDNLIGRNDALKKCVDIVSRLALRYDLKVVDYYAMMMGINEKVQGLDPQATIIGADRVHPGPTGHFLMSYQLLKTLSPLEYVSSIDLNASSKKILIMKTSNAKVSKLEKSESGIRLDVLEKSLPFPVSSEIAFALSLIPFQKEFNTQLIRISGLPKGNYQVSIDGKVIGSYQDIELVKGIDLATNTLTPQYQHSQNILQIFRELWAQEAKYRYIKAMDYNRIFPNRIYELDDAKNYINKLILASKDTTSATYKDLLSLQKNYLKFKPQEPAIEKNMRELKRKIYSMNRPEKHTYTISKI